MPPEHTPPMRATGDPWRALCAATRPDVTDPTDVQARGAIESLARLATGGATAQQRDDLVADARAILWEAFDGYDPGRPFKPWAVQVLRFQLIDRMRRAAGRGGVDRNSDGSDERRTRDGQ